MYGRVTDGRLHDGRAARDAVKQNRADCAARSLIIISKRVGYIMLPIIMGMPPHIIMQGIPACIMFIIMFMRSFI